MVQILLGFVFAIVIRWACFKVDTWNSLVPVYIYYIFFSLVGILFTYIAVFPTLIYFAEELGLIYRISSELYVESTVRYFFGYIIYPVFLTFTQPTSNKNYGNLVTGICPHCTRKVPRLASVCPHCTQKMTN